MGILERLHSYNIDNIFDYISPEEVLDRLPFPSRKKTGSKYYTTCMNPHHEGAQTGGSPPAILNKKNGSNRNKLFCFSCKNYFSIIECIRVFTEAKTDKDVLDWIKGDRDFSEKKFSTDYFSAYKQDPPKKEDELFNQTYAGEIPDEYRKTVYIHESEEFMKRGMTKEFIDNFYIQICDHPYYGDRFTYPIFGYDHEGETRLFGWEARTLDKDIQPKVLYATGSQVHRVLFQEYDLDYDKTLYLVEGVMDIVNIWQGISKNVTCVFSNGIYSNGLLNQKNKLEKFKEIVCIPDNCKTGETLVNNLKKISNHVKIHIARLSIPNQDPGDASVEELKIAIKNKQELER